ncbi:MAG: hypothetical protein ACRD3H_00280, partial [Terriglobales bacterium]
YAQTLGYAQQADGLHISCRLRHPENTPTVSKLFLPENREPSVCVGMRPDQEVKAFKKRGPHADLRMAPDTGKAQRLAKCPAQGRVIKSLLIHALPKARARPLWQAFECNAGP